MRHSMIRLGAVFLAVGVLAGLPGQLLAQDDDRVQRLEEKLDTLMKMFEEQKAMHAQQLQDLRDEIDLLSFQLPEETAPYVPAQPLMQSKPSDFNPTITVFTNALYRVDDRAVVESHGHGEDAETFRVDDKFNLRETELDFRAAIDPYADGVLILAAHAHEVGHYEVAVEEAYANIKCFPFLEEPPLGMQLKVGRFLSEFGRFNRLHTHDLPQSVRPLAVEEFLTGHGHTVNGASLRFLLPFPCDEDSALELTLQAFQGGHLNIAEDHGQHPGFLGNLRWSRTFADEHYVDLAWITHFGYNEHERSPRRHAWTHSVDFLYKWKPLRQGEWNSFLFGGQVFFADRSFHEEEDELFIDRHTSPFGGFLWSQYQFDRRWYAGVRGDYTTSIENDDIETYAVMPYLSYYLSEYLRLRLSWEHRWSDLRARDDGDTVFLELNWIFGSHPPHPFWVNR